MNKVETIKKLRELTGLGLKECKDAMEKTPDFDKALKYLQENAQPSSKPVGEGGIFTYTHHNRQMGAILELKCATDFVSRSPDFHKLGSSLVMHIAAMNPQTVEELLSQDSISEKATIKEIISLASAKFNEPIVISRFNRYRLGCGDSI